MSQFLDELRKVFGPGTNRIGDVGAASDGEQLSSVSSEVYYLTFQVQTTSSGDFILRDGTATADSSFTDVFKFSPDQVGLHTYDYSSHPLRFDKGISLQFSASGTATMISQVQWSPVGKPTTFQ